MENAAIAQETQRSKSLKPSGNKKISTEEASIKQRYIYIRKDHQDPIANLIEDLLIKCNLKDYGANVDFSMLLGHSLKLLKEEDISEIQNSSLSDEDRVNDLVSQFNNKNGTNYTMYEFVLNGLLKKSKKGVTL